MGLAQKHALLVSNYLQLHYRELIGLMGDDLFEELLDYVIDDCLPRKHN